MVSTFYFHKSYHWTIISAFKITEKNKINKINKQKKDIKFQYKNIEINFNQKFSQQILQFFSLTQHKNNS